MSFGKIKVTNFGQRHFDPKFGGTKITDFTPEEFENTLNSLVDFINNPKDNLALTPVKVTEFVQEGSWTNAKIMDGYAPFCKLIAIPNFTNAKIGTLPIKIENYQYLRSGYSARAEKELPVMSRWFELPVSAPKADYLIVVVYSREQLEKEFKGQSLDDVFDEKFEMAPDDAWGVVAILGQTHAGEEPMAPITMMRNALGISQGGSGVDLNKEKYLASVEFWNNHAIVKS